ncbi:MAG: class I SAM-dependent methyltransferase [Candidatus Omnitrophota bacterium]
MKQTASGDITCVVCGGRSVHPLFDGKDRLHHLAGNFRLHRCGDCGLAFVHPFLDQETLGRYYPEHYYSYSDSDQLEKEEFTNGNKLAFYLRHPLKAANCVLYSKILGQNRDLPAASGMNVLDVGCGDGKYLLEKRKSGADCFGVDISPKALARLRQKDPSIVTHCGHLWDAAFPADHFDVINFSHVLEHVTDIRRLLGEAKRVLKKDGRLRVQVPNMASLTRVLFGPCWMGLDVPRHVYVFSGHNLKALFRKTGFTIEKSRTLENSYSVLGSSVYVWNELSGKKHELEDLAHFWDSEWAKLALFPYAFIVNALGVGDVVEFIVRKN